MVEDYPVSKDRELTKREKEEIKDRIRELDGKDLDRTISDILSDEFNCSPSQIAGLYTTI